MRDECARITWDSGSWILLWWEVLGTGDAVVIGRVGGLLCEKVYRGKGCGGGFDCEEKCCVRASVCSVGSCYDGSI